MLGVYGKGSQPFFDGQHYLLPEDASSLRDTTPLGLREAFKPFPRVAAKTRQPWAVLSNRFAVQAGLDQSVLKFGALRVFRKLTTPMNTKSPLLNHRLRGWICLATLAFLIAANTKSIAQSGEPSREPIEHCGKDRCRGRRA